eukprot:9736382-Heterocapsa_arctica.AAC.1
MRLKKRLPSPKAFRNTCSETTSDTFNTLWLGRMHSKTQRSKVHPLARKADKSSDLNNWDMKYRSVEIMSTV